MDKKCKINKLCLVLFWFLFLQFFISVECKNSAKNIPFIPYYYNYSMPQFINFKNKKVFLFSQLTLSGDFVDRMYDYSRNNQPIAEGLFKQNLKLGDVYLASKLADKGLLTTNSPFGRTREEQYIALLAATNLLFYGNQNIWELDFDGTCNFYPFYKKELIGSVGIHMPIKDENHFLELNTSGGILGAGDILKGETNIRQYFNYYNIDFIHFLKDAVLNPKDLNFVNSQSKRGLGNVSIFTSLSLNDSPKCTKYLRDMSVGLNFVLPDAQTKSNNLWPVQLGNTDFSVEVFGRCIGKTSYLALNPYVYLSWAFSFNTKELLRLPKLTTENDFVPLPDGFGDYYFKDFVEWDVADYQFADKSPRVSIKRGSRVTFLVGNLFQKVFKSPFSFSVAYQYFHEFHSQINVLNESNRSFSTQAAERSSERISHKMFLNLLIYKNKFMHFYTGINTVVAGKNMPISNNVFISIGTRF